MSFQDKLLSRSGRRATPLKLSDESKFHRSNGVKARQAANTPWDAESLDETTSRPSHSPSYPVPYTSSDPAHARSGEPKPYSVRTLAERWGCSQGAVRQLIRSGEVASFTIGKLVRIPNCEVERYECQR